MFHYLVGVRMEGINSETPGKKHMDFMIEWTDKDIEAARIAKGMTENHFWKTSNEEAIQATGITELAHSLTFAHVRARVNDMLLLRYDSEFKWEENLMATHIQYTDLEELKKAKIPIMHRFGRP
jgi:hypothetical protein